MRKNMRNNQRGNTRSKREVRTPFFGLDGIATAIARGYDNTVSAVKKTYDDLGALNRYHEYARDALLGGTAGLILFWGGMGLLSQIPRTRANVPEHKVYMTKEGIPVSFSDLKQNQTNVGPREGLTVEEMQERFRQERSRESLESRTQTMQQTQYLLPGSQVERYDPKSLRVSSEGIKMIEGFEDFRSKIYRDQSGNPTTGIGDKLKPGEKVKPQTYAQAKAKMLADLADAERMVKAYVQVPLSQNEYNALSSLVYNAGIGNLEGSLLFQKLNSGDYVGAASEFDNFVYYKNPKTRKMQISTGLVGRRDVEKDCFLGR